MWWTARSFAQKPLLFSNQGKPESTRNYIILWQLLQLTGLMTVFGSHEKSQTL